MGVVSSVVHTVSKVVGSAVKGVGEIASGNIGQGLSDLAPVALGVGEIGRAHV